MPLTAADLLAGPIVRRVDTERACVWMALSKPATVTLQVFRGRGVRADLGAPLPAGPTAAGSFENRTIAVGARLHVALAVFEPAAPARLDWGEPYSYDVRFVVDGSEQGLDELGLLQDHVALPGFNGAAHPHLALGYDAGVLPSFVLPPLQAKDLRVAHGSCRRHCVDQRDATALLDDLVSRARLDPAQRIHQLLFTGDQVYADAVSTEQLRIMIDLSTRLLGDSTSAIERIPIDLALDRAKPGELSECDVPVDAFHLPPSRRTHLINDLGGGTSTDAEAHTLGFGEAAALYLTAWAGTTWPDLAPRLAQRWELVADFRTKSSALMKQANERLAPGELDGDAWKDHAGELRKRLDYFEAWRLLPRETRWIDRHLTEADQRADWLPTDDPKPEKAAQPYAWDTFWTAAGRPGAVLARLLPGPVVPDPLPGDPPFVPDPVKAALARALTPSWYAGRHFWFARISYDSVAKGSGGSGDDPVVSDSGRNQLSKMQWYLDDLPRVRRVMANTPTLMIFDDHEVTDDWNISASWARRTYGSSLGRAMVRNMLAAYALFQHWGNDPLAFRRQPPPPQAADAPPAPPGPPTAGYKVLEELQSMFFDPATGTLRSEGPPDKVRDHLDTLFDLRRPDEAATPSAERMTWHFAYRGSQHELLALDSRTWRAFETESDGEIGQPASDLASASLISDESLVMQVPDAPEPGSVLSLVITPAPFIGMPVAEGVVQPTLNAADSVPVPPEPPFVARGKSSRAGRMNKDPEPFGFVPRLFEAMLARLANRRRVVFLSGDVHYSVTLEMSYWRLAGDPLATRFVQLISSSLRNPRGQGNMELFTMDLVQQLGQLTAQQARLGWKRPVPGAPPVLPVGDENVSFRIRRLLGEDPVMLPPDGLPAGTATAPVEWAWRIGLVPDARPDALRLEALDPPLVQASLVTDAAQAATELARRHRWESENTPPRRWMWWTNVGVVDFAADAGGGLSVRHHLYSYDVDGVARGVHDRMAVECSLEIGSELPPAVASA